MKDLILSHLNSPTELEKLYRKNKSSFKTAFAEALPEIQAGHPILAEVWNERLNYESDGISWGTKKEFTFIIIISLLAGFIAKFPEIFTVDEEFFYPRNLAFLVFPGLAAFFAWKNQLSQRKVLVLGIATTISWIYINLLPSNKESDTLILACIHLPLLLWGVLGAAFSGNDWLNMSRRLAFLRFNGDAIIMGAVLGLSGMALTGLTIGLFELIGLNIVDFYTKYILIFGAAAIPPFAAFLTQTNPQLVNKVSPVIAKIFSPLVLIMLIVYLGAIAFTGKDPYNDREFLLIFNLLLVGVKALIFFSIAEKSSSKNAVGNWILLALSIVTILVNGIALSAIIFRISEWGITPNRLAVLGVNVLMLIHLIIVGKSLWGLVTRKLSLEKVGISIAAYLPVYFTWTVIIVFLFPILFGFR
ncbi:DUF4153 domain-containing protein [Algoriphagus vanfongensis]|uniref:DUF4153 domain-containing protein n=1 Tax=Algoriphagus vanfongensis TaxID=426371 RepID=UPI00042025A6|nr:DUF4153 domain-containing protein [Algoriphagus vanfongensis]